MHSVRAWLSSVSLLLLAGCVVAPYAPVMQATYTYQRHPGVVLEVWMQYDAYGTGYQASRLVNRGNVDKCAWTDFQDSRLLRSGETWQVGQVTTPGGVGVSDVVPGDPGCVNAKRQLR